jgi:hypothetical protein
MNNLQPITNATTLVVDAFPSSFTFSWCRFYDADQKAITETPSEFLCLFRAEYLLDQGEAVFKNELNRLNIDHLALRFAVGKSLDKCYYFSKEEINKLKRLGKTDEIVSIFNKRFQEVNAMCDFFE